LKKIRTHKRKRIAFFEHHDVFEDFYPHYGVDQNNFATKWAASGNHAYLSLIQQEIGDVVWYSFSIDPKLTEAKHEVTKCTIRFLRSSWTHRLLWRIFYISPSAWRWQKHYRLYSAIASYMAMFSWPFIKNLQRDFPDFLMVQDYASGRFEVLTLIANFLNVPLIARHSGSRPEGYIGNYAKRWTLPLADWLIASSEKERSMLVSRYGVSKKKISIILTPIDTDVFRPLNRCEACRHVRLDPKRRYLLYMGRLENNLKRVKSIVEAFCSSCIEHLDADLLIVGTGPDEKELHELARTHLPDRIKFLGWISNSEEKAQIYNVAECLILASKREGFPSVLAESMACGTPVITSDVGGVREMLIDGETGFIFPPGNDEALENLLYFVMSHPRYVQCMRTKARTIAECRVSPRAIASGLKKGFERIENQK
jgi:glycosyltransferase involved in cell wall biosynthesis